MSQKYYGHQYFFQAIIIWYCVKPWCVKCVPRWQIICHEMILFFFPSTAYVKTLLEFLIHDNSSTKSNKKLSFGAVSYSSLLVMISSLISCMCKLVFACKKIYNFSSSRLRSNVSSLFLLNDLILKTRE